jgi:hypothetical protein
MFTARGMPYAPCPGLLAKPESEGPSTFPRDSWARQHSPRPTYRCHWPGASLTSARPLRYLLTDKQTDLLTLFTGKPGPTLFRPKSLSIKMLLQ